VTSRTDVLGMDFHATRPQLCRGLLVEGAPNRAWFTGAASTGLLPRLLPLLDGTRELQTLSEEADISMEHLHKVLVLLQGRGLLDESPSPAGRAEQAGEAATFFSRSISLADGHRSSGELSAALGRARVFVVGPPAPADAIVSALVGSGLGDVLTADSLRTCDVDRIADPGPDDLVVHCDDGVDPAVDSLLSLCRDAGVPILRCAVTATHVEIGPRFTPGVTACIPCFRSGYANRPEELRAQPGDSGLPQEALVGLMAGWAAAQVLAAVAGATEVHSPHLLSRVAVMDGNVSRYYVLPEASCDHCRGPRPGETVDTATWPLIHEHQLQIDVRDPLRDHPPNQRTRNMLADLVLDRPPFWTEPRLALPQGDPTLTWDRARRHADQPSDLLALAGLLRVVAGQRTDPGAPQNGPRRWAPTGGNLASVAAYVLEGSQHFGLPGTVHRYDDVAHELISLYSAPTPLDDVLSTTDLAMGGFDYLTGAVGRLSMKYQDFACRLAHLDAGCAVMQLQIAAENSGFELVLASTWGSELADALELEPDRELVTAVVGLRTAGGPHADHS
jgi:hypothetical protein